MNKSRKLLFNDVISALEEAKDILTDIQSEEEEAYDSLPESLQESERGEDMQYWIDFIDDTYADIDDVINQIEIEIK